MDIGTTEDIEINALGGTDSVTGANGLVTRGLLRMRIDGGDGIDILTGGDTEDTILGGLLDDTLNGGDGNDTLTGGDGNDTMNGGNGDDTMIWNPGDDNDILNGEAGNDTMLFNGANVNETITITAAAPRVTFFRDVAAVTMDVGTTETLQFNGLGGDRHDQRRRQPRGADDRVAGSRRGQRRAQHGADEQGDRRWRRGRRHAELQRAQSADPDDAEHDFRGRRAAGQSRQLRDRGEPEHAGRHPDADDQFADAGSGDHGRRRRSSRWRARRRTMWR